MENETEALVKIFYGKDVIARKKARYELIKIGKPAISYLTGLLNDPKMHIRWEAIKTLSQIAAPESIPVLIKALENDDFDVRWMAAEGLIDIGKQSIKPLLKALSHNEDSNYLLEGAHHILKGLEFKKIFKDDEGLIKKLENYNMHPEIAVFAEELLSKY
jgi:HEAT repeat protein